MWLVFLPSQCKKSDTKTKRRNFFQNRPVKIRQGRERGIDWKSEKNSWAWDQAVGSAEKKYFPPGKG